MSYYSPSASQCIMGTWATQGLYFPITLLQGLTCPPAAETQCEHRLLAVMFTRAHHMRSDATPNQTETKLLYYIIL